MSHRMVRTALTVLATVTALVATSAPASANVLVDNVVRIAGEYGSTEIAAERFRELDALMWEAQDPNALLATLPVNEQLAVLYDFNPSAITEIVNSAAIGTDCDENPRECAEGVQGPTPPNAVVAKPEQPPNIDPNYEECEHHKHTISGKNIFGRVVYDFWQNTYRCWNGIVAYNVHAVADYDVHWMGWSCVKSETPPMPIHEYLPPQDQKAPKFVITSTGSCRYAVEITVFGKGIGITGQQTTPNIETTVNAFGWAGSVGSVT